MRKVFTTKQPSKPQLTKYKCNEQEYCQSKCYFFFLLFILIFSSATNTPWTWCVNSHPKLATWGQGCSLPLYSSGFLFSLISAVNCPTLASSVPNTIMIVGLGKVTLIPSGTMTYTVCEHPSFIAGHVLAHLSHKQQSHPGDLRADDVGPPRAPRRYMGCVNPTVWPVMAFAMSVWVIPHIIC